MRLAKFFKSILLAYLIFAGVFLLCSNISSELFTTDGGHQQMATSGAVHEHAFATIPNQLNIMALVLLAVFLIGTFIKFNLFLFHDGRLYIKKWRGLGDGMRLFNYLQRLFACGILNSKLHNFVTA